MPKFTELMLPVLEVGRDKQLKDQVAEKILAVKLNLEKEDTEKIKSSGGERLFLNKIRWAKTHLIYAKLLQKKRGFILITPRGQDVLSTSPEKITEKYLSRFEEYRKARGWNIKYERRFGMPSKWSFQIQPIAEFLDKHLEGKTLDPFCGQSDLADVRNDINPNSKAHVNLEALVFLHRLRSDFFDTVLYDGIYSPRQQKECYDEVGLKLTNYQTSSKYPADIKDQIARVTKLGGKTISFGWNSNGMGKCRGFEVEAIMLVPHGANHNDTIITVERKIENKILVALVTSTCTLEDFV